MTADVMTRHFYIIFLVISVNSKGSAWLMFQGK